MADGVSCRKVYSKLSVGRHNPLQNNSLNANLLTGENEIFVEHLIPIRRVRFGLEAYQERMKHYDTELLSKSLGRFNAPTYTIYNLPDQRPEAFCVLCEGWKTRRMVLPVLRGANEPNILFLM